MGNCLKFGLKNRKGVGISVVYAGGNGININNSQSSVVQC